MAVVLHCTASILGVISVSSAAMKCAADKWLTAILHVMLVCSSVFLLFTGCAARYGTDQPAGTAGLSVLIVSTSVITSFGVCIEILLVTLSVVSCNDIDLYTDLERRPQTICLYFVLPPPLSSSYT